MFYRLDTDTNTYKNSLKLFFPGDIVLDENNKIEHDGWKWYDKAPIPVLSDFEKWELRVDAIKNLKDQANESPLQIRNHVIAWYEAAAPLINSFIADGNGGLLNEVKTSDVFWWDLKQSPESESPREVAEAILVGLVE